MCTEDAAATGKVGRETAGGVRGDTWGPWGPHSQNMWRSDLFVTGLDHPPRRRAYFLLRLVVGCKHPNFYRFRGSDPAEAAAPAAPGSGLRFPLVESKHPVL